MVVVLALAWVPTSPGEIDPGELDPSVKPQDDFFRYVNGRWIEKNPIPPDRARWGIDYVIDETNVARMRALCEAAAAKGPGGSAIEREVGDLYTSAMDQAAIDAAGAAPLAPEFKRIDELKTPADVVAEMGHLKSLGLDAGFRFLSDVDDKDSSREIAEFRQGGLGLPDRDDYFRDDEKSKATRSQYLEHIRKMFVLLGDEEESARMEATAVIRLETGLAHASLSRVVLRNPYSSYHMMLLTEATRRFTPDIDWSGYLREAGAPAFTELNLAHPQFLQALDHMVSETPVADWKAYLRWNLVNFASPFLSRPFEDETYDFYSAKLRGTKAMLPRWKRTVKAIDKQLGDALGQLFVEAYFPPESKARVLGLVADLRKSLRQRISALAWMDGPTKSQAFAKLDALNVKVGYPDKWKDYRSATINRGAYITNILQLTAFEVRRDLHKIGGPVDPTEWHMTPPTVNAYYNPSRNEIVFPAGTLQPPFFDPTADDAFNYGGIGATIGHELTHGFDDQGRQYDAKGNLTDWWTKESADHFKLRAEGIVKQFSAYTVLDGLHVNGRLTEGENIADLGGLLIAFDALEAHLAGKPRTAIDGYTPEQRFFFSYAESWRDVSRPESERQVALTGPQSPDRLRVNGPLSNMPEFAAAFAIPENTPMRRMDSDRVAIW